MAPPSSASFNFLTLTTGSHYHPVLNALFAQIVDTRRPITECALFSIIYTRLVRLLAQEDAGRAVTVADILEAAPLVERMVGVFEAEKEKRKRKRKRAQQVVSNVPTDGGSDEVGGDGGAQARKRARWF
ncbi:hypothetical protein MMC30_002307 [Trapelia coarctata]|nr:hypothetical protein [Trapelia coarctata]